MNTHIVVFQPDGACVEVEAGTTIIQAAAAAGVTIDSACGQQGTCGKCKVLVHLGRPGNGGHQQSDAGLQSGMVLACQATVEDDLVVEIPAESQRSELRILALDANPEAADTNGVPLAEKIALNLRTPGFGDGTGDAEALLDALWERRGASFSGFELDLAAMRALPTAARRADWHLDAVVGDFDGRARVIGVAPAADEKAYGLAVDVGTTTVVVCLIDLSTGGFVDSSAYLNDQVRYGEDVIARIIYSQERPGGLMELRDAVLDTINLCILKLTTDHRIPRERIVAAACAGNTVMTHLLLAIDPTEIRRDPYVPAVREIPVLRAGEIGLQINPGAPVHLAPCVSSYVGGDITAGVLATGMADSQRLTLFVDLGTNGEIVIGNQEWLACCSCSAGPAFEGSGLEYGMYATSGAMERIFYDSATDRVNYRTIGGTRPRGICGSGLIDTLAELRAAGVIDRAGRIDLGFRSSRVRVRNERPEFVLVWAEDAGREDDISISEDDIQNLIRSKAAVYAGVATLMESLGLEVGNLDRVLLAGGFGNYIDAENAVTIGLLPDVPLESIRFVGNTSLAGARMALLGRGARTRMSELARRMTNFELSTTPGYMERYVSGLFLPHTDLSLFPSVMKHLGAKA